MPRGPFSACHAALSPSEYFRQCVYDLCTQKGNSAALCRSLSAYTAACQAAGVAVKPWRTDSFCRECPWAPGRTSAQARGHPLACSLSCVHLRSPQLLPQHTLLASLLPG